MTTVCTVKYPRITGTRPVVARPKQALIMPSLLPPSLPIGLCVPFHTNMSIISASFLFLKKRVPTNIKFKIKVMCVQYRTYCTIM